jgi:hypothetical protein
LSTWQPISFFLRPWLNIESDYSRFMLITGIENVLFKDFRG